MSFYFLKKLNVHEVEKLQPADGTFFIVSKIQFYGKKKPSYLMLFQRKKAGTADRVILLPKY